MTPLATSPKAAHRALEKVRYTHDAMIDTILANPGISQNELALHFGYSVGWVSTVMNSDAFQARLADRKDEVVTPEIKKHLEDRMAVLADQSLTVIQKKLQATQSPDLAIKALELSTKALGMGARPQNAVQNNTFVVALPQKAADENAWAAQAREGVLDVTPKA